MWRKIYIIIVIVIAIMIEMYTVFAQKNDDNIVNAFSICNAAKVCTTISVVGEYEKGYMSENDKFNAIKYISKNSPVDNDDIKFGKNSNEKCVVHIEIKCEGADKNIIQAQKDILKACNEAGFNPKAIITIEGELVNNTRSEVKEKIFTNLNVKESYNGVINNKTKDEIYYGYSDELERYTRIDGKKVNVTLAFVHDEIKDVTKIYLATPILNMDV